MTEPFCRIPYRSTFAFSDLVNDYLETVPELAAFYKHPVNWDGMQSAIAERQLFNNHRTVLVQVLRKQYATIDLHPLQEKNITALLQPNTFTITTAHQPNIFTGPLYFIYKILHAIRLAEEACKQFPANHFVPVYYMGSEDADLEELGHFFTGKEKHIWDTKQQGAVGRMNTEGIDRLIQQIEQEFGYFEFGNELIALFKTAYLAHSNIQTATLHLVNALFKNFGLIILMPDNAALKSLYVPIMQQELLTQFSGKMVANTMLQFPKKYKVQAAGRDINLFYLHDDGRRERIVFNGSYFSTIGSNTSFTEKEIIEELNKHPERFSPNVILRGVFQETILPNIAFIGGGAELAYWMELLQVFGAVNVPFPVLVLRNSIMLVDEKAGKLQKKLGLSPKELFLPFIEQQNWLVRHHAKGLPNTQQFQEQVAHIYQQMAIFAKATDPTLEKHTEVLATQALKRIKALEKKIQREERRKLVVQNNQLNNLRELLFPNETLQERQQNFIPWYALYGEAFITELYQCSLALEQNFTLLYFK